jgi:hypothetical protein
MARICKEELFVTQAYHIKLFITFKISKELFVPSTNPRTIFPGFYTEQQFYRVQRTTHSCPPCTYFN